MRTTLDLDETLLREATDALAQAHLDAKDGVPVLTKTFVVESALRALIKEKAARRVALMYGAETAASPPGRRRREKA